MSSKWISAVAQVVVVGRKDAVVALRGDGGHQDVGELVPGARRLLVVYFEAPHGGLRFHEVHEPRDGTFLYLGGGVPVTHSGIPRCSKLCVPQLGRRMPSRRVLNAVPHGLVAAARAARGAAAPLHRRATGRRHDHQLRVEGANVPIPSLSRPDRPARPAAASPAKCDPVRGRAPRLPLRLEVAPNVPPLLISPPDCRPAVHVPAPNSAAQFFRAHERGRYI